MTHASYRAFMQSSGLGLYFVEPKFVPGSKHFNLDNKNVMTRTTHGALE